MKTAKNYQSRANYSKMMLKSAKSNIGTIGGNQTIIPRQYANRFYISRGKYANGDNVFKLYIYLHGKTFGLKTHPHKECLEQLRDNFDQNFSIKFDSSFSEAKTIFRKFEKEFSYPCSNLQTASGLTSKICVKGVVRFIKRRGPRWSVKEENILRENASLSLEEIKKKLNRPTQSICRKAGKLKIDSSWIAEVSRERRVSNSYPQPLRETAMLLAEINRLVRTSVNEKYKTGTWESVEDNFLRESYGVIPACEMAATLGRKITSVYDRIRRMGLVEEKRGIYAEK